MRKVVGGTTGCLLVVLLVACPSACGGSDFTVGSGGTSTSGGSGGAGAASGGGGSGGAAASVCPAAKPQAGSPCSDEGLGCSYGDNPRPVCRERLACNSGQWQLLSQAPPGDCNNFGSQCGSAPQTGPCQVVDTQCAYADGVFCACISISTSSQWRCSTPPGGNCPPLLPNEGELCNLSESCSYGSCNLKQPAVVAKCNGGRWTWELDPCA